MADHLRQNARAFIYIHAADRLLNSQPLNNQPTGVDSAPTKFQLKDTMHINWLKPNLNQHVHRFRLYILSNTLYLTQICNQFFFT